ncbi:MAG: heptosyltransferase-2 [Thermoproteota archaeon]|jgi:heptosyltransferase-2
MEAKLNIALIRFSSMGDVVLQTSLLAALKNNFDKKVNLIFITSSEFSSLLEGHPYIDELITFDRKSEKFSDLKTSVLNASLRPDILIDLHATLRSKRLLLSLNHIPSIGIDKRSLERFLLTKFKINLLKVNKKSIPQVTRILRDLKCILALNSENKEISDFINTTSNTERNHLTSIGLSFNQSKDSDKIEELKTKKFIGLVPSASYFYKRWPVESFVSLAKSITEETDYEVVIFAGPSDSFCDAFNDLNKVHNLQGKTNLKESCSLTKYAKLIIGNDTGIIHIAESLGVPVIDIFGPTHPDFGFFPHMSESAILSADLPCKPCSSKGEKDCKLATHECMLAIKPSEVLNVAKRILSVPKVICE